MLKEGERPNAKKQKSNNRLQSINKQEVKKKI